MPPHPAVQVRVHAGNKRKAGTRLHLAVPTPAAPLLHLVIRPRQHLHGVHTAGRAAQRSGLGSATPRELTPKGEMGRAPDSPGAAAEELRQEAARPPSASAWAGRKGRERAGRGGEVGSRPAVRAAGRPGRALPHVPWSAWRAGAPATSLVSCPSPPSSWRPRSQRGPAAGRAGRAAARRS